MADKVPEADSISFSMMRTLSGALTVAAAPSAAAAAGGAAAAAAGAGAGGTAPAAEENQQYSALHLIMPSLAIMNRQQQLVSQPRARDRLGTRDIVCDNGTLDDPI